ncbi:MAG TPA: hypothetical protein VF839_05510 [Clostridium sp.]
MRKMYFNNSKFNNVKVLTSIPTEIILEGSTINSLNLSPIATNFDGNRVKLTGDFKDSQVQITSSCILESGEKFLLNNDNKINVHSSNPIILNPLGDFNGITGIVITSPCNIVTTEIKTIEDLNIFINIEDFEDKDVGIIGDFSGCNFYIESKCFMKLDGKINNLSVNDSAKDTNIWLNPGSKIASGTVDSMIYISGQEDDMDNFKDSVVSGANYVIKLDKAYIIPITNGEGSIGFSLNKVGKYKISVYIQIDNEKVDLGDPINIDISQ